MFLSTPEFNALKRVIYDQEYSRQKDIFDTVWDEDAAIHLPYLEFEPVEMYGFKKFRYRPGLKKINLSAWGEGQWWRFELIETPELTEVLTRLPYRKVNRETFDQNGFRQTGVKLDKNCRVKVLFVGDSFTEGLWVEDDEAFPAHFGKLASREAGSLVCAINGGVNGYSPIEEAYTVENFYSRFHYPVVYAAVFPNDIDFEYEKVLDGTLTGAAEKWEMFFTYFEKIAEVSRARSITPVFVIVPDSSQFKAPESRTRFQDKILERCEVEKLLCIDLYGPIQQAGPENVYLKWDAHFSPRGHQFVAELLWNRTRMLYNNYLSEAEKK